MRYAFFCVLQPSHNSNIHNSGKPRSHLGKGKTFLEHFHEQHAITNPNVVLITENKREEVRGQGFCFFPYGEMQTDNLPTYEEGDVLVAHIRGVPLHTLPSTIWKASVPGNLYFSVTYTLIIVTWIILLIIAVVL